MMARLRMLLLATALAESARALGLHRRRSVVLRASLEAELVEGAGRLPALPVADARAAVVDAGVARVPAALAPAAAAALRARILAHVDGRGDDAWRRRDDAHVPGTRIRFAEAVSVDLDGGRRADVLLPLRDGGVAAAVRAVAARVAPVLEVAAATLPGDGDELELVECAALVSRPGADHQPLHADYLRFDDLDLGGLDDAELDALDAELDALDDPDDDFAAALDRARGGGADADDGDPDMPPRVVCFVYLQACPTKRHGPTVFLPATATAAAHEMNEFDDGDLAAAYGPAAVAACDAGDAVIYDAAVLHFGAANAVADRVVLYFSVARAGAAADAHAAAPGTPLPDRMRAVAPVPFASIC